MKRQHYVLSEAEIDPMSHEPLPLDTQHYLWVPNSDPLMVDTVDVTNATTGVVKEVLPLDHFEAKYTAVDTETDDDQPAIAPDAPIVTSPNGTQFAISVDDDGIISATQVAS